MPKQYIITFTRSYIYNEDDIKALHDVAHAGVATKQAWQDFKNDIKAGQPFANKDNFKADIQIKRTLVK